MSSNPSLCFFIINLEGATQRFNFVSSQIEKYAIPVQRVSAINGSKLIPPYPNFNERKFHILFGKKTNPNVIGCFHSHLKAMRQFLESDYDLGIVLEDDACISNTFESVIKDIKETSTDWDLLRLSATKKKVLYFKQKPLSSGNSLAYNLSLLKGTCGYVINKKAAKNMLNGLIPFYLPIDIAIESEWRFKIKSKCLLPFPIKDAIAHKQINDMDSQIPRGTKIPYYRFTAKMHNMIQKIYRIFYRLITSTMDNIRKNEN